jgi:gamma-glutamylcyclotransferase (GGCT)/AIG2-like uncharacterized protein YtfP
MNHLPIWCYGTLRPGGGNDALWRDVGQARHDGTCYVVGHKLVGSYIPYLVPQVGAQTVGTLVVPDVGFYHQVLHSLDQLEGHPNHYTRRETPVLVKVGDGTELVTAWAYHAGPWYDDTSSRFEQDLPTNDEGFYDHRALPRHQYRISTR